MAIKRTSNVFKAFLNHFQNRMGFRSDYFWVLLNGGRQFRASLGVWDVNHPDWDSRCPLAVDDDYLID